MLNSHPRPRAAVFWPVWFLVSLGIAATTSPVFAQLTPGRVAITASIPQGPDVGMSYALSEGSRLNLGLGFAATNPDLTASRSEFFVRPGIWWVEKGMDNVSLLYGGAVEFSSNSGGGSSGDIGLFLQAGAEYAIGRSFSVGSVAGLGFASGGSSASGARGSWLGTAGVEVFLTWWVL